MSSILPVVRPSPLYTSFKVVISCIKCALTLIDHANFPLLRHHRIIELRLRICRSRTRLPLTHGKKAFSIEFASGPPFEKRVVVFSDANVKYVKHLSARADLGTIEQTTTKYVRENTPI